jgi:hypothetical protein
MYLARLVHGKYCPAGNAAAAKRPAVFVPAAIKRFRFLRQKGRKILLFERLALIL